MILLTIYYRGFWMGLPWQGKSCVSESFAWADEF